MNKLKKLLAVVLVALFMIQPIGLVKEALAVEPTVVELQSAEIALPKNADDNTVKKTLFDALVVNKEEITLDDLSWEYYCQGTQANGLHLLKNKAFGSVFGFTSTTGKWIKTSYNHPALADIADGKYTIRLNGGVQEVTVDKKTAADVPVVPNAPVAPEEATNPSNPVKPETSVPGTNEAPAVKPTVKFATTGAKEVVMPYTDDNKFDYKAAEKAIYDTLIKSATYGDKEVPFEAIKVEHGNTPDPWAAINWAPLDKPAALINFGLGINSIRISCADTEEYKGANVTFKIKMVDARKSSQIAFKNDAKITYNMNADAMKQQILDEVIDWNASNLPAKNTVDINDFVFEYKGINILPGNINGVTESFAPINGGHGYGFGIGLTYPQMGAKDEAQTIRVSYNGDSTFLKGDFFEGKVFVEKANVQVRVKPFAKIKAGESLPKDFITLNPQDKFDIYKVYIGLTTDATVGIYIELPERYTNSDFLNVLDPIVKHFNGKSVSEMLNDGMTVAELREFFKGSELIESLEKLNINTGTFGEIIKAIDKMPSLMDSTRVSFGSPNRAGKYSVTVITDNVNYNTGIGVGTLNVKKQYRDNSIQWNTAFTSKKLTVEEAKAFDFTATLYHAGSPITDKCNIKYTYTGFTNWGLPYASSKAPTKPGRYMVTAYTVGGNFYSFPSSRTFQIVK